MALKCFPDTKLPAEDHGVGTTLEDLGEAWTEHYELSGSVLKDKSKEEKQMKFIANDKYAGKICMIMQKLANFFILRPPQTGVNIWISAQHELL